MKNIILIIVFAVLIVSFQTSAQETQKRRKTITGQVLTMHGEPVKGALLFVDGITVNKKSNRSGNFKIKVKNTARTIAVYSDFHGSEEINYTGQDTISFNLSGSFNASVKIMLEEDEYVDVGYGKVRRDDLTTTVGSVRKEKINMPHYTDIYTMIQGEVPGVTVAGNRIIIRGIHTIQGDTQPLFVVDGVIVTSISHIIPVDVESIDILKGASASIYGINGANGVILINTKKARRK